MTKKELYNQSLTDLLRAAIVLSEVLENKELTRAEEGRIKYGTKLINDVKKRQNIINKR